MEGNGQVERDSQVLEREECRTSTALKFCRHSYRHSGTSALVELAAYCTQRLLIESLHPIDDHLQDSARFSSSALNIACIASALTG